MERLLIAFRRVRTALRHPAGCALRVGVFALLISASSAALAEQRDIAGEKSEKVDAVLLLDSSGSMLINDPQRLRDEGARLFSQFLKPGDNLAIIDFSEEARVVRPLSPYASSQLEDIGRQIASIRTEGQFTDLMQAVEQASALLDEGARPDAKPVVVLLSDGKMEPPPYRGTAASRTQTLLEEILPEMKSRGRKIYTLAFSQDADKELLQQIASGTDAVQWFTETAEQVHQSYAELFLAVKKPQVIPLSDKGFSIDENVSEATFYINREEGKEIKLQHPSGQVFTSEDHPKNIRWFPSPKFEVITIEKPDVGLWRLGGVSPDDGFATILTNLRLVTDWGGSIDAGSTELLQARMYEAEKPVALPEMTGLIKYAYQVTPTDRVSEPIVRDFLVDEGRSGDKIEGDGIFSHHVTVDEPGEYVLRIIAKAPTFERQLQIPFRVRAPLVVLYANAGTDHAGEQGHNDGAAPEHSDPSGHTEDAHGKAEAPAHGAEEHGKDAHDDTAVAARDKEQRAGADGVVSGDERATFVVELSEEAKSLKRVEVELVALNEARQKLILPLEKAGDSGRFFEASAALLPQDGRYEVRAVLSAEGRGKSSVHQSSKILQFKRISSGRDAQELHVVAVAPEAQEEGFPVVGLVLLIVILGAGGGAGVVLAKRSGGSVGVEVKEVPVSPEILAAVAELEERSAQAEIDVNDPSFDEEPQAAA